MEWHAYVVFTSSQLVPVKHNNDVWMWLETVWQGVKLYNSCYRISSNRSRVSNRSREVWGQIS